MVQQLFPDRGHEQLHICTQCQQNTARDSWPVTGKASVHYKKVPASTGRVSGSENQTVLNQTTTEREITLHKTNFSHGLYPPCSGLVSLLDFHKCP